MRTAIVRTPFSSHIFRPTVALVFVDVLGVKDQWPKGAQSVQTLFRDFRAMALNCLEAGTLKQAVVGGIESDSVALVFPSTLNALLFARHLFRTAFASARKVDDRRWWLRGAITTGPPTGTLRQEEPTTAFPGIRSFLYSDELLNAIAVEKSGFKGMRILVENTLVTKELQNSLCVPIGKRTFIPVRKLNDSYYPIAIEQRFQDYLWMAPDASDPRTFEHWERSKNVMARRLRWSAKSTEETTQAAATQVVFHEASAIIRTLVAQQKVIAPVAMPAANQGDS